MDRPKTEGELGEARAHRRRPKTETDKLMASKFSGIQHTPGRLLQPFAAWRRGKIIHFCKTESDADHALALSKSTPIKVPAPLPIPLPLHGDNGGKNKGGSHHRRLPGGMLP